MRSRPWLLILGAILWAPLVAATAGRWTLFLTTPLVVAGGAALWRRGTPGVAQEGPRDVPTMIRRKILSRDRGRCRYCAVDVHYEVDCPNAPTGCPDDYHADHVLAWANEGSTVEANLVASCRWCNVRKGAMPVEEFVAWLWSDEGRAALADRFAALR